MQSDAQENGWLLDGYPRSLSQAKALEDLGIRPDLFVLLDVSEDILVEKVVGRRLDPVTGKIYHLKYSPPENEEISARLTQRFDDTEEKVNGDAPREDVFAEIDNTLSLVLEKKAKLDSSSMTAGMAG
ncbi:uncharacterized protein A4U43_C10F9370 [Asparagus officinalis]|uniref:adenylate kinase n=1 Tax=Asparagus officinalis TaxID=4686 RepID=A0A5P1E1Y5_ASPOF|nr:uncharacterized protein A4U43_C10F9370 [Asparagus officinalis]